MARFPHRERLCKCYSSSPTREMDLMICQAWAMVFTGTSGLLSTALYLASALEVAGYSFTRVEIAAMAWYVYLCPYRQSSADPPKTQGLLHPQRYNQHDRLQNRGSNSRLRLLLDLGRDSYPRRHFTRESSRPTTGTLRLPRLRELHRLELEGFRRASRVLAGRVYA